MEPVPVYIIHYCSPEWLEQSITSLVASDLPVSISVIDNSPLDLQARDSRVRLITPGTNTGFSGAGNIALRDWLAGDAEFCILGSHDFIVHPDTLRVLLDCATQNGNYGALGPRFFRGAVAQFVGARPIATKPIHGGGLLLRRAAVLQAGGFDEDFGSYGEDEEYCFRLLRNRWSTGVVWEARAHDLGSAATNRNRLSYGNMLLLSYKTKGWFFVFLGIGSHLKRGAQALLFGRHEEAFDRFVGLCRGVRSVLKVAGGRGVGYPSFKT